MAKNNKKRSKNNRNNKKKIPEKPERTPADSEDDQYERTDNDSEQQSHKRYHSEDESDTEEQPERKKKKKPIQQPNTTDKKGKKSIRQMKREKHAQRMAEEAAAAKDQLKSQCITYLSQWKHDRENWKFMKAKQVWLYKNKFSPYLLPESSWPILLEYFESAKGNIRNLLLEDANKIIKQMDEWTETQNLENESQDTAEESKKPDEIAYKRARDLIQCLQE